jgi:hypothetical protein
MTECSNNNDSLEERDKGQKVHRKETLYNYTHETILVYAKNKLQGMLQKMTCTQERSRK